MFRSILLPTLVAGFIAVPMLYQKSTSENLVPEFQGANRDFDYYVSNAPQRSAGPLLPQPQATHGVQFAGSATRAIERPPSSSPSAIPVSTATRAPTEPFAPAMPTPSLPAGSTMNSRAAIPLSTGGRGLNAASFTPLSNVRLPRVPAVDFLQMTPDYGAAETYTFRGDANGPDLTTGPMQFAPVTSFKEVFRFDVSPVWVKQRWERLTTIPPEGGLHGLRTALVTGTNSWDLNGALTYFFDQNHRTQRISFRGWVGAPTRLINLVTQHFGLRPQPTHWAGLYVANFGGAQTAGLLMKDPNTIDNRNRVQRTAVIMEINQPAGGFRLSKEFLGFMRTAIPDS